MAGELQGKTIASLATVSLESGEIQGFNHLDKGDTFQVDKAVAEASAAEYDGLVLPGGVANPDFLRNDPDAVQFVRSFFEGVHGGQAQATAEA